MPQARPLHTGLGEGQALEAAQPGQLFQPRVRHPRARVERQLLQLCQPPQLLQPYVGHLGNLRELSLAFTEVTDEGLKELRGLTELESLSLDSCPGVTDAGLRELAGLSDLQSLTLAGTRVKGPGLRDLSGLKRLRMIEYGRAQVTDEILRILREAGLIHALSAASGKSGARPANPAEVLGLDLASNTGVTDASLKEVKSFRNLQYLFLSGTPITDGGVKELRDFGQLSTLDLSSTAVTDLGLKELGVCKRLEAVYLRGTRVTDAGVKELEAALPRCKVMR